MRAIVLTALFLALPVHAMAVTAAVAEKPVARIDSLIATSKGGRVTIQAKGAVTGGGWTHIALKPVKSADAHTMVVEFVGQPPASNEAVIHGLLPVAANLTLKIRKGVIAVRAISDANEITTQILK